MARTARIDPLDGWHHVMNRGVDRSPIFFSDEDRIEFGRCVGIACERFGVEVHAYCLMTNHFHLLLRCPQGRVSEMMKLATGMFAQYMNRHHGRVGHLFGDRFTSRLVTTHTYILNAVRYIHRNALDIESIERCGDHRWSSHRNYLGLRPDAPVWIRTDVVLEWFDGRHAFAAFVDDDLGRSVCSKPPSIPTLLEAVDLIIDERSETHGRRRITQRRAVALGVAESLGIDVVDEILELFGQTSVEARRAAVRRSSDLRAQCQISSEIIDAAVSLINASPASIQRAA